MSSPTHSQPKTFSLDQIVTKLHITKDTLIRWLANGKTQLGPAENPEGRRFTQYEVEEIERYAAWKQIPECFRLFEDLPRETIQKMRAEAQEEDPSDVVLNS